MEESVTLDNPSTVCQRPPDFLYHYNHRQQQKLPVCEKSQEKMPSFGYSPAVIKDWLIGGVDFNLAGNGGPTCTDFTPPGRRYFEFIFGSLFGVFLLGWAYRYLSCHLLLV